MRKWIGFYENIISNELCDNIIDYGDNVKPLKSSTYASHKGQIKNSEERVKMDDGWFRNGEKYYEDIKHSVTLAMSKYMEKHKDIAVENEGQSTPGYKLLKFIVQSGCKAAIKISEKI